MYRTKRASFHHTLFTCVYLRKRSYMHKASSRLRVNYMVYVATGMDNSWQHSRVWIIGFVLPVYSCCHDARAFCVGTNNSFHLTQSFVIHSFTVIDVAAFFVFRLFISCFFLFHRFRFVFTTRLSHGDNGLPAVVLYNND